MNDLYLCNNNGIITQSISIMKFCTLINCVRQKKTKHPDVSFYYDGGFFPLAELSIQASGSIYRYR
ncbi:hypothetical protein DERF_013246 [Dermatophagoides farinae]|uniref:Uncharacterized protein n=1 Tax=Dermatophagoides farinae TaxID=6954 RepID=A0A922HR46_DERFA|nr:hypothetical protein DERF_013246 [Dermatophagoides farinae]